MYLHPFNLYVINNDIQEPQFLMNILDNMGFTVSVIIKGANFYFKVDENHYFNDYIINDEVSFMSRVYYILREILTMVNPNYSFYRNIYYLYNILYAKLKNVKSIKTLKEDCLKLFFEENPIMINKEKLFKMQEELMILKNELNNIRSLLKFEVPKIPQIIKNTSEISTQTINTINNVEIQTDIIKTINNVEIQTNIKTINNINIQTDTVKTINNYCQTTFSMSPRTNCDLDYLIKHNNNLNKEISKMKKQMTEYKKLCDEKDVIYSENIKNKNDIIDKLEKRSFCDILRDKQITSISLFNFISTVKTDICANVFTTWKIKFIYRIAKKDFMDKTLPNFAEFWTIILYRINTHIQGTLGKINIEWNAFNMSCAACGVPISSDILNLLFWFMCDNYIKKELGVMEFLPNFFQSLLFYCASIPKLYKIVMDYTNDTNITTEKKFDYTTRFLRLFLIKKPYDLCELIYKDMTDTTTKNYRFLEELF